MQLSRNLRSSLIRAFAQANTEDKVRGFLAVWLIGVLIALVFDTPGGHSATTAVAAAKTLAIAVVAFYFGLHKGTPHGSTTPAGPTTGAGPTTQPGSPNAQP